jgi:hypothetical protein
MFRGDKDSRFDKLVDEALTKMEDFKDDEGYFSAQDIAIRSLELYEEKILKAIENLDFLNLTKQNIRRVISDAVD